MPSGGSFDGDGAEAGRVEVRAERERDASMIGRCRAVVLCSGGFEHVCVGRAGLKLDGGMEGSTLSVRWGGRHRRGLGRLLVLYWRIQDLGF